MFPAISDRQKEILALVIRSYIEDGIPVGSKTLVDEFGLDFSSATVRNELATLGEKGFLGQWHTSGGRVPTELGYRYFVQEILSDFHLPRYERQMIRHQFHQARLDMSQWMRLAAAILSRASNSASFVTAPRPVVNRFKHLELISTQGRLVLMILVMFGGEVNQQMLTLAEPVSQARLSGVTDRLNRLLDNATEEDIAARMNQLDALEQDVIKLILEAIRRTNDRSISDVYLDGLVNLVDDAGTRQAVRVLEERALLADVLLETQVPEKMGVQVVIGGEGRWEEFKDCTMILSRYGVMEQFSGTIAVVGSTRMPYGRNVAAVRYVSDLMSGFVYEYYLESPVNSPENEARAIDNEK